MQKKTQDFFIHFNLEWENSHSILLDHSIITEETIKTVIFELNKIIFGWNLQIEIRVLSAEEGSLLKKFWIGIITLSPFVLWNFAPDIGNWIVMALWDWREVKEYVRDYLKAFLQEKNQTLVDEKFDYDTFYKAYSAKNKFYQETLKNPEIKWLWFSKEDIFPVSRNEFAYRIVDLKHKTSLIDPIEKFHKLKVVSPINTKEDKELCRQVKDVQKKSQRFNIYMEDQNFYDFFLNNPFFINTFIVKVSYHIERDDNWEIQIKKKSIVNVYQYNDTIFTPLPEECIIEKAPWELDEDKNIAELKQETKIQWLFDV